jgi:hypothetical protein
MPASSGRLSAIMSTGHEAELHSQARASWKCSRARSPRPRRSSSTPKRKAECKGCSIERPGGLTLSSSLQSVLHGTALRPVMFDAQVWSLDRKEIFGDRVGRHR